LPNSAITRRLALAFRLPALNPHEGLAPRPHQKRERRRPTTLGADPRRGRGREASTAYASHCRRTAPQAVLRCSWSRDIARGDPPAGGTGDFARPHAGGAHPATRAVLSAADWRDASALRPGSAGGPRYCSGDRLCAEADCDHGLAARRRDFALGPLRLGRQGLHEPRRRRFRSSAEAARAGRAARHCPGPRRNGLRLDPTVRIDPGHRPVAGSPVLREAHHGARRGAVRAWLPVEQLRHCGARRRTARVGATGDGGARHCIRGDRARARQPRGIQRRSGCVRT
jgi:hypothetical protein